MAAAAGNSMLNRKTDPDKALVARSKSGDLEAFEELVREHQRPLFSYLYHMCRDTADAEEMTQLAFVQAWRGLSGFKGKSSFRTWLYRIATNLCINRRTRARPTVSLSEGLTAPESDQPESAYRDRKREEVVWAALDRLPKDQRSALVLSVYEEMSYREIAATLGKSVRAVDSLLFRARTNVRRVLGSARERGVI